MIIDYTNLRPGDKAPDPLDPNDLPNPSAPARVASANVIVLAADPTLLDLLRDALAGIHRIWRADDATHAADLLVASNNAVLLVDASLADQDTHSLVTRLHEQFPDLAIIVAGQRSDEAQLAPLVSSGAIFRFLHKPASAERIRNFVDATQRRPKPGSEQAAAMTAVTGEHPKLARPKIKVNRDWVRRWSRRSLLLVTLLLAVWGLVEWKPWNHVADLLPKSAPAPIAPTDAGSDPRVLRLLDAAGLALSQRRLVAPPKANALELYRAVLATDPGNRMAQRGIAIIADEMLVEAERALMERDLPRLVSAVDAARSARPDHPRLEFFVSQLERERELQANAEQSPRTVDSAVGQRLDASAAQTTAGRVQNLVTLANERMRGNRLTRGKDSALAYLQAARQLDPADPGVKQGIDALIAMLQANVQRAVRESRIDDANQWLHHAVALNSNAPQIAAMRADIETARVGNVRADRARLLMLANQRIAQGQLLEPAGDSARHFVDLLRAADPAFDGLADTSALLAARALAESRELLAAGNTERADALLRAAADAGAPSGEVTALAAQIGASRAVRTAASARQAAVLPESALHRTRTIPPSYPTRALERGIQGWVDLEYTVGADGTTGDIVVRAAEPEGVFDRAAVNAVQRWRYEPRVINGAAVDQRVEARVRFQLKE